MHDHIILLGSSSSWEEEDNRPSRLEETRDLAGLVDGDVKGRGALGEARHGHDRASEHDDELSTGGEANIGDVEGVARGSVDGGGVIGEGVLGLGNAHGEVAVSVLLELLELGLGLAGELNAVSVVEGGGDGLDLVSKGHLIGVERLELGEVSVVSQLLDRLGELEGTSTTVLPLLGDDGLDAHLLAEVLDNLDLGLGVGGEAVDRDDAVNSELGNVLDVADEVGHTGADGVEVLGGESLGVDTTVELEGTDSGDNDGGSGGEAGLAALDVEELLGTKVSTESTLSDDVVSEGKSGAGTNDGRASVGDVGEGSTVDDGKVVLEGLHNVGVEGILEKSGHGTLGADVTAGNSLLAAASVTHDDVSEAVLEVLKVRGKAEDGHDLRGDGDVEVRLTGDTVAGATEAKVDLAESAVVHVEDTSELNTANVELGLGGPVDVVVNHGSEQVVRGADGVEITGEVKVDVGHGDDLGVATTSGTTLDTKDGAERGLTEGGDGGDAVDLVEAIGETDGGAGLALTGLGGGESGDEDELTLGVALGKVDVDLGLVAAVEVVRGGVGDGDLVGEDVLDGLHLGGEGDALIGVVGGLLGEGAHEHAGGAAALGGGGHEAAAAAHGHEEHAHAGEGRGELCGVSCQDS